MLVALAACRDRRPEGGVSAGTAAPERPGRVTMEIAGRLREYTFHLPPDATKRGPMPLVVSLHGGGGAAEGVERQTGWETLGDREGFVVAYPSGVGKSWNDGRDDTPSVAVREGVDDVTFLARMIEDLGKRVSIDPKRVYMNGISNGGFMSARFACERADLVAAIGVVVSTLGPDVLARCAPSRPMSVIAFNGTADPLVPYQGGVVRLGRQERGRAASFSDTMKMWARGCTAQPPVTLPDVDHDDDSTVRLERHTCPTGASVDAYTIEGGGHTWPGGRQYLPKRMIGPVNRDIDATALMWRFFVEHPAK